MGRIGHTLKINSLHDAQAECSCGWHITCTGERTEKYLKEQYNGHIEGSKTWRLIDDEVNYENNSFEWIGNIANFTRRRINLSLSKQGISIESHGVDFVNKCIIKYLDSTVINLNTAKEELKTKERNIL